MLTFAQCEQLQSELMALAEEKQLLLVEADAYRGKWERLNREMLERAQGSLKAAAVPAPAPAPGDSGSNKSTVSSSSSPAVGASNSAEQLQSLVSGFSLDLDAVFAENRSLRQRVEELSRGGGHTPTQPSLGGALQHTMSRYLSWRTRSDSTDASSKAIGANANSNAIAPTQANSQSTSFPSRSPAAASATANLRSGQRGGRQQQPNSTASQVGFGRSDGPGAGAGAGSADADANTPPEAGASPSRGHTAVGPNMQTNMLGVGLLPFTLKRGALTYANHSNTFVREAFTVNETLYGQQ